VKCLVIGAGLGGLTAATALAQRGIDVDVVEQRPDSSVVGVGINQPANAMQVARSIGILDACLEQGFAITGRAVHDHHGHVLVEDDLPGLDGLPASNGISRKRLSDILHAAAHRAGVSVRFATTVRNHDDSADGVTVTFSDSVTEHYDAVAAFDGIRSAMRRELFGDRYEPVHTGFGAFRVTLPRPPDLTRIVQFIGPTNKAGLIPLSEDSMYLFLVVNASPEWRPDPAALVDLLRAELAPYTGAVADLRDALDADANSYFSPIEEVLVREPWARGRVILAGDAAHASSPHLTQGGAQAMEDGLAVALELSRGESVSGALSKVVQRRAPRAALAQRLAHSILLGEMNYEPEHRAGWPDEFRALNVEARQLLVGSIQAPVPTLNR
jgi:2-polyprenyl-6-methoxyphenol hydroxylase-like FAD-dependent oxidoreductase